VREAGKTTKYVTSHVTASVPVPSPAFRFLASTLGRSGWPISAAMELILARIVTPFFGFLPLDFLIVVSGVSSSMSISYSESSLVTDRSWDLSPLLVSFGSQGDCPHGSSSSSKTVGTCAECPFLYKIQLHSPPDVPIAPLPWTITPVSGGICGRCLYRHIASKISPLPSTGFRGRLALGIVSLSLR